MVSAAKAEACTNDCGCPAHGGGSLTGFTEETSEQRIKEEDELPSGKGIPDRTEHTLKLKRQMLF